MTNPYDVAYQLAKALKESAEYKNFSSASESLKETPDTLKQVRDFFQKQLEAEFKMMSGGTLTDEEKQALEKLYHLIQLNPEGKAFLENQMKFQQMMSDIMKIINESTVDASRVLMEKDA